MEEGKEEEEVVVVVVEVLGVLGVDRRLVSW